MNQPEDNFIGRWSRRKRDNQQTPEPSAPEPSAAGEIAAEADTSADVAAPVVDDTNAAERPLTDADMAPVESLDGDSDYAPFLSEGVSSELRKAALKKLFFSGKFAARDGLDDYDDDFTYFEPLGDTVTSDMKYHARRKEKERLARLEEEAALSEAEDPESPAPADVQPSDQADTADQTRAEDGNADKNTNDEPSENDEDRNTGSVEHAASPQKGTTNGTGPGSTDPESGRTA
jgi:hypothetical protein